MAEFDEEALEDVLRRVLHEKRHIEDEMHASHHKYINLLIEREERRKEAWRKFKMSFIGGLGLTALGALIWLGKLMIEVFRHGPPTGGAQ